MSVDPRSIPRPTQIATRWVAARTITAAMHPSIDDLLRRKRADGTRVSVVIPAPERRPDLGRMCEAIASDLMREVPLVDELVILVDGSSDDVAAQVPAREPRVVDVREVMPEVPAAPGTGDTRWRGLSVVRGDIVVWLDSDPQQFDSSQVTRLVAPLLMDETIGFVKGYHEPAEEFDIVMDDVVFRAGGQRTTELLVRPLMNLLFPELAGFFQPLEGASAGRMELLRRVPFLSGCSVDVALLIDVLHEVGLDGLAQVELGPKTRYQRSLDELGPDAHAIARTIFRRAQERERIKVPSSLAMRPLLVPSGSDVEPTRVDEVERPPLAMVPPYLEALRSSALPATHDATAGGAGARGSEPPAGRPPIRRPEPSSPVSTVVPLHGRRGVASTGERVGSG